MGWNEVRQGHGLVSVRFASQLIAILLAGVLTAAGCSHEDETSATMPGTESELPVFGIADFRNIDIPAMCGHTPGSLVNGELDVSDRRTGSLGLVELVDVVVGQLDDDPDPEYVLHFYCGEAGTVWPTQLALYDSDQTSIASFNMADMYVGAEPWDGSVSFEWSEADRIFAGSASYQAAVDTRHTNSWAIIESPTCIVAWSPVDQRALAFNSLGGPPSCGYTDDAEYVALGTRLVDTDPANGEYGEDYDDEADQPSAEPDSQADSQEDTAEDVAEADDGDAPGPVNPEAVACDSATEVFTDYLLAAGARDYSSAWSMLTQDDKDDYDGYGQFARFWDTVSLVGIEEEYPQSTGSTRATTEYIMFYDIDTGRQFERVRVETVCENGVGLIDDYQFLEIVSQP